MFSKLFGKKNNDPQRNVCGGQTDYSDYDAPKVINSDELVLFETHFYRRSDFVYEKNRSYYFKLVKNEDETFTLTEGDTLSCVTGSECAAKIQGIIRKYNLVELNGINRHTAGLPPEYSSYWVKASYASGEQLYFSMNGNPEAEWTWAVLDTCACEFGRLGIDDLMPVKEASMVKRFSLEYAYGDIRYMFSEILVPVTKEERERSLEDLLTHGAHEDDCITRVYEDVWDRSEKTEVSGERMAELTDEYYQVIKDIIDSENLIYYQNGRTIPSGFDYKGSPEFYSFYIEYESGKRMSGFSDEPEKCATFKKIAESFSEFFRQYFEEHLVSEEV